MCGITGILDTARDTSADVLRSTAERMAATLAHRGPDDSGVWVDADAGIALGHRRLSILDLSEAGHQPMVSASGRCVIVFNGEIYNFEEIRAELLQDRAGLKLRGHSDTEIMLEAIEHWGLNEALNRFNGMFAFGLWDREQRTLSLARDRLGIKPLYYGWLDKQFVFGSELKALRSHPAFNKPIDRNALGLYFLHGYITSPYTIYEDIRKLPPGTILTVRCSASALNPLPVPYWSARETVEQGIHEHSEGTERGAAQELERLLRSAIKMRMVADVPLGAFLSGGIDSSTMAALMQAESRRPVKTFTIGFEEGAYNEAEHAKQVAAHLGTEHTELYVKPRQAMDVIPAMASVYDEPFADSSQVPTFLVSQLTRKHVTVSLSGDGGDELLYGYTRYQTQTALWRMIRWQPRLFRYLTSKAMLAVPTGAWDRSLAWMAPALYSIGFGQGAVGSGMHWVAELLPAANRNALYERLVSLWPDPAALVPGSGRLDTPLTDRRAWRKIQDFAECMMAMDLVTYLPDDILVKVDRASMAHGLEARVPLLDHRIVEFVWRLPMAMKADKGLSKRVLRRVLYRYLPRELMDRPKMGFGVPVGKWLQGPLRDWAEDLLAEDRLRREGYVDPRPIRKAWKEHLNGKRNHEYKLWAALMFEQWLEEGKG